MFADIVLGSGLLLQGVLLFRGWWSNNLRHYPYFYAYIATSFLSTAVGYLVFLEAPAAYSRVFWPIEYLTLFVGCGLVVEIFGHVLSAYPGADRFAKMVCAATFVLVFLFGFTYLLISPSSSLASSQVELERNVRAIQIFFFLAIVGTISYYRIELGKNIRGLIYGYGLYLSVSVVAFALRLYYHGSVDLLRVIRPLVFDVSLLIWLIGLWSYQENPMPTRNLQPETDYESLASLTKAQINAMRSHLGRSTRG